MAATRQAALSIPGTAGQHDLQQLGALLFAHLFPAAIQERLRTTSATHLFLRLDDHLVHLPWELAFDGEDFLLAKWPIGRQVITDYRPRAERPALPKDPQRLRMLIIVDPTESLPAAAQEADQLCALLDPCAQLDVAVIGGKHLRKLDLLRALNEHDLVHYAGHAYFDAAHPTRSGWVLDKTVVTALDLSRVAHPPLLVFANACQAGTTAPWPTDAASAEQAFGLGSAFLLAGVHNYIGTFCSIHDTHSAAFAADFYRHLLQGRSLGEALAVARSIARQEAGARGLLWASYVHYGNPTFQLPLGPSEGHRAHPAAGQQGMAEAIPPHVTVPPAPEALVPQEETDTWRCAVCQHAQRRAARVCVVCGAPHGEICVACGQAVPMSATFCSGCGQRLRALPAAAPALAGERTLDAGQGRGPLAYTPLALAEKIRTARVALEGERKQITVLFADLKDSLELIRDLDPEAAQQLLDPALHAMMDAVHRYEGTVNQVLGDGIMALFGAPIAHEDHAIRACYAALAMQAALGTYAEEVRRAHAVALQSRIGLNSGEVVVRTIRNDLHMDYSAVGQTTHLAARMEQVAHPGTIVLTAATVRLVEGLARLKAWGPMPIKGLAEPVEVFELLGASGQRRRLQTARARGLTRFVGRQTELAALHAVLAQAGAGHGQVVAVVGEAGVGKSRLVDEFVQAAHTQGWLVLDSAAVSYGQATPYFPVRDLLRRYCHLEEGEDTRAIQAKVTEQVRTLDAALEDMIPALLALLDALPVDHPFLQLDPLQRRQRTFVALKRVLVRQSQGQPLLLVCEDLHWLDTETQALLESLSESLPTARLLLLVNYRPDYRHGWGSKTYYTQLRLAPLPPAHADTFLQALLGDDPRLAPLTQLLIQRTEGNPFFLEESVRTLVETGALVGEPGAYHVAHALPAMQVPATVQAVLAARIDRLPPEEKRLLQTAAVIGTEVPLALLQVVAELPAEAVHLGLAHLQDAEFLYEASLFPERVYTFKHGLTQEVAYSSLLQVQRRTLHARIVKALESLAGDQVAEQVERLAHHAVRGEVWDKAVPYCQQAGTRAYDRAALREAVASFDQALQALEHLPEPGDTRVLALELRLGSGCALGALGEYRRWLALLGEAEALARALDDRARLGRVLAQRAEVLRITGDYDRAMATGQQALALAVELGESALQEQASNGLGGAYLGIGDFGRAAELLRRTVAADRASGTPKTDVRIRSRAWLARTLSALGAFAEGRRHGEEALRLATLDGRGATPSLAHAWLGLLYLTQGDLEHATRMFNQGLALSRASGNRNMLPQIVAGLGYAYALQGRLAEGCALLEEAISESISTGARRAVHWAWLSEGCRLAGHGEDALQHARQALDLARQQKGRGDEALALHQLGVVHAHADPPDVVQAEAHYQQALVLAEELGMRPLQAHCHRGLGMLYAETGQREQARAALSTAIEMYRVMAMTFWLPQAEAALAQVEGR